VSSDYRSVEDDAILLDFQLKRLENRCPVASKRPIRKAVEHGLPLTETLGEIAPGDPGLCSVQHGVNERSVVELGLGPTAFGHDDTNHCPLRIGQSMTGPHTEL
jgi:hypothetical protein